MGFGSLFGSIGKAIKKVGGGAIGTVNKAVKGVAGGVNKVMPPGIKRKTNTPAPVQSNTPSPNPNPIASGSIFGSRKPLGDNSGSIGGGQAGPRMGTGKRKMGMRMQ